MVGDAMIGGVDLAVVVAYFAGIIGFGAYAARHSRGLGDFFLGGQRFAWWLVAFSCVATVVGSYSFVKYSAAGFRYGLSSSQTYLNDWFWMPLWMFGWLPIVYFGRITSVPEYFERRFSPFVRSVAMALLLVYLVGYLGINFLTMGRALEALVGWPILAAAGLAAVICGVYTAHGGQTAVIFTDLAQGVLLLIAGVGLFVAGIVSVGGLEAFWDALAPLERQALARFNEPPDFNFVGIFWQDGMAGGIAFYFMNQGILLRFLSARSVSHARRAATFVLLALMPLAAIAVSGAGWIGRAMVSQGSLPTETSASAVFVIVAERILPAGFFGLVVAALIAALMSTADTLINAIATIAVNDFWCPWRRARSGRQPDARRTLRAARIASIAATLLGFVLVPVFAGFGSIYRAHGTFTAAITPPLAIALVLAICWRRISTRAILLVMIGGTAVIGLSFVFPELIHPLSHGVDLDAGTKAFGYIRALFGVVVCLALGIIGTLFWPQREDVSGLLVVGSIREKLAFFKGGGEPKEGDGPRLDLAVGEPPACDDESQSDDRPVVVLRGEDARRGQLEDGDLATIAERHWFRGGYQCVTARVRVDGDGAGLARLPGHVLKRLRLRPGTRVTVRRLV